MLVDVLKGWRDRTEPDRPIWTLALMCGHEVTAFLGPPEPGQIPGSWWCRECAEKQKTKEVPRA